MSDSLSFTVPLVPPSVNHYVKHTRRGRHYVTAEGQAFKDAVAVYARRRKVKGKTYSVALVVFLGAKQRGDVDNFPKCVLDGLTEAGVIHSDAAVTYLIVEKHRDVANPRTEIAVTSLDGWSGLVRGRKGE